MKRYGIIHRSQSRHGCQWHVDQWHRENEWGTETNAGKISCGYHYIVLNGWSWTVAQPELDGQIVPGRPPYIDGAHTKGWNKHVGICYMGMSPTPAQIRSMLSLCTALKTSNRIVGVYGHDEILKRQGKKTKGCPNIDMDAFRKMLR